MQQEHFHLPHPHIRYTNPNHQFSGFFICFKKICFFLTKTTVYVFFGLCLSASIIFLSIGCYIAYYGNKIIPQTSIANASFSGLTIQEAQEKLYHIVASYTENNPLEIQIENISIQPQLKDIGIEIEIDKTYSSAWKNGHSGSIMARVKESGKSLLFARKNNIEYTFNQDVFYKYFSNIKKQVESPVKNASITFQNSEPISQVQKSGKQLNLARIELEIRNSVARLQTLKTSIPLVTVEPQMDESDIVPTIELTRKVIQYPIELQYEQKRYSISKEQIISWITYKEERQEDWPSQNEKKYLQIYLKNNDIQAYLETKIAPNIDQSPTTSKVIIAKQKTEILEKGKQGKKMDREKLLALIQEKLLEDGERIIEIPVETTEPIQNEEDIPTPQKDEGKQIVVSLKKQLVYAFEGKNLVYAAKVSTGIPGHKSPLGSFKVYGKSAKQKMSGPGYYLPNVPWILWYHGDYSLHGTYWHNNFGHPMSHGCTNLSIADAKWFFDWAPAGTPVTNIE